MACNIRTRNLGIYHRRLVFDDHLFRSWLLVFRHLQAFEELQWLSIRLTSADLLLSSLVFDLEGTDSTNRAVGLDHRSPSCWKIYPNFVGEV